VFSVSLGKLIWRTKEKPQQKTIRKMTPISSHTFYFGKYLSIFLWLCLTKFYTLSWQLPLLVKGWSNKITSDDFNTPLKCHDSKKLSDKLEKQWEEEMKVSKKPSLIRVLTKLYGLEYLFYGLVYFCFDLAIT
jgi:hypothetical protein